MFSVPYSWLRVQGQTDSKWHDSVFYHILALARVQTDSKSVMFFYQYWELGQVPNRLRHLMFFYHGILSWHRAMGTDSQFACFSYHIDALAQGQTNCKISTCFSTDMSALGPAGPEQELKIQCVSTIFCLRSRANSRLTQEFNDCS